MTIYLDHNATTPAAPKVVQAVRRALETGWGNPSSAHAPGRAAGALVSAAREQVAALLDCEPGEIIFTSGGTESDNLALMGAARARRRAGRRIVVSAIEHPAVEAAASALQSEQFQVVRVQVKADGRVRAGDFIQALSPDTAVASLMHANNETGALQPVPEVAAAARERGIPFHTDAAQSVGKMPVSVHELGVDLLTLAGHKLYGPKGIGALYVRPGTPLEGLLKGAPQERGLRPGTENTPGIAGLGAACALAAAEMEERVNHARTLIARLLQALQDRLSHLQLNGPVDPSLRLPNTLNIHLPGLPAHRLAAEIRGVATSAGAACHSLQPEPSAVLMAMGMSRQRALASLRLSVGRSNSVAQMDEAASLIAEAASRLLERSI
ncbi:MAG: cysteine desulfurase family protein [Acidobacteriota bacterium]